MFSSYHHFGLKQCLITDGKVGRAGFTVLSVFLLVKLQDTQAENILKRRLFNYLYLLCLIY